MSVASTLLDQTEALELRLDRARLKHTQKSNPNQDGRRGEARDLGEIAAGILTQGGSTAVLAKKNAISEHAFRLPEGNASSLLRQIATVLKDGTDTLDRSPAFQQSLPQLRASLAQAAAQVVLAEKAA